MPSPSHKTALLSFSDVDGDITYASATDILLATDAELTEMTRGSCDTDEEFARIINKSLEVRFVTLFMYFFLVASDPFF